MNVGFLFVQRGDDDSAEYARAMIGSVRATMPGVPVVQFTNHKTPALDGVDAVRRLPAKPMALLRFQHQAAVSGDWLFLDTDVLIQRDVRSVFNKPFDVALTTRNWPHLKPAVGFTDRMPFNAGVVFSRSQHFWRDAVRLVRRLPKSAQRFLGHQQVICDLAMSGRFRVVKCKGSRYNFPPYVDLGKVNNGDPVLSDQMERKALILHYKGPLRKALMLERSRVGQSCA